MARFEISDEAYGRLEAMLWQWCEITFESPFWFDGDDCFCLTCAQKEAARRGLRNDDMDGGFCTESDVAVFCGSCGKPLEHTLTEHGAAEELAHYEESGLPDDEPARTLARYTLVNISGGVPLSHQKRLYKLIFGEEPQPPPSPASQDYTWYCPTCRAENLDDEQGETAVCAECGGRFAWPTLHVLALPK